MSCVKNLWWPHLFCTIGDQNQPLKIQMDENAVVFEQVADLVEQDPTGVIEES